MRQLILKISVTIDGFVGNANGDFSGAEPMNCIPKIAFSRKGITGLGDPANTTASLKYTTERRHREGAPLTETPDMDSWTNARIESDLVGTYRRV